MLLFNSVVCELNKIEMQFEMFESVINFLYF